MTREAWRHAGAVLVLLIAASLACSVEFSTAHFQDVRLTTDPHDQTRARTFAPGETFYCVATLKDAPPGTRVEAVWLSVSDDGQAPQAVEVARTAREAGSGPLAFEAAPPEGGWPRGAYRLELYVDGDRLQTLDFTVR